MTDLIYPKTGLVPNPIPRLRVVSESHLDEIAQVRELPESDRLAMRVVASVLPFRVNGYVIDELINWDDVPNDPIFQLVFPQPGMLSKQNFERMESALRRGADREERNLIANEIRAELNPHPAGQQEHNVPVFEGRRLDGVQHKYAETVLFFPGQGQTCHSYCTFCFRWAQFIGDKNLKFAATESGTLHRYLATKPEVTDLLMTGGDPMVMKARHLERCLEPLLEPELEHVQTIRIGSKALSFWPQRFVTDPDADDVLRLFERLSKAGKQVAFMAHIDHWRELETDVARHAIRRLRDSGVVLRSQAPLLRHINDSASVWAENWRQQVNLGIVPYYMFVERDTGARAYFEVPLHEAVDIYREAWSSVSGLARTARGPSMSAGPGKIELQGEATVAGERVFVLRFIQARNPDWVQRPFFARWDENATWLTGLVPAFGEKEFFFEPEYRQLCQQLAAEA